MLEAKLRAQKVILKCKRSAEKFISNVTHPDLLCLIRPPPTKK